MVGFGAVALFWDDAIHVGSESPLITMYEYRKIAHLVKDFSLSASIIM